MALAMSQVRIGTVVEHYYHFDDKTGKTKPRSPIRRGVIHHTEDDEESGALRIWVQFKRDGGPEKIPAAELNIVHGPTKETLKIVSPTPENAGEFVSRDNPAAAERIPVENDLKLGRPVTRNQVAK